MNLKYFLTCVLFDISIAQSICYNIAGRIIDNGETRIAPRQPCDPSAKISHCCSLGDICLSNGLCLDASGDHRFTVQGCTDPNWQAPCLTGFRGCLDFGDVRDNFVPLWMCRSDDNSAAGDFCCGGNNTQCCVDAEAGGSALVKVPGAHDAFRASAGSSAKDSDGSATFGLVDKVGIATAVVFGVLGASIGILQPRYMAKESQASGHRLGWWALLRRQLGLWLSNPAPSRGRGIEMSNGDMEMSELSLLADQPVEME
jgi:hypothetical protein